MPGALRLRRLAIDVPRRRLLTDVDLRVEAGECIAIMGPSGAGKTSLLNTIAGITMPVSGSVDVAGVELSSLTAEQRSAFRLRHIGMIFQFVELLPELTSGANVALPLRLAGVSRDKAEQRALSELDRVGVSDRADAHPDDLSGGQQQLVGLARALVHAPQLVLADEPTGMLDETNSGLVVSALMCAARDMEAASVIVTHDPHVANQTDRVLTVMDGRLVEGHGVAPRVVTNP